MTTAVRLDEDYHVHSTFSDGASTLEENVAAASQRGLRRLCLTDHVRADTRWLPEYTGAVRALGGGDTEVLVGVETKLLDLDGHLDLPPGPADLDLILVADHQYPGARGPVHPSAVRDALGWGAVSPAEVIGGLVGATVAALARLADGRPVPARLADGLVSQRPLLAHLFSILPKMGLTEAAVGDDLLALLASRTAHFGAMVEINEKWGCPSARAVRAFAAAGVPVVAGSDSHDCRDIGVFTRARQIAGLAERGG